MKYMVRKVGTCSVCKGDRFFPHPTWEAVNKAFYTWQIEHGKACMDDEACAEWDRMKKEAFPYGEPPEELPCGECDATGRVDTWVDLSDALRELGLGQ